MLAVLVNFAAERSSSVERQRAVASV